MVKNFKLVISVSRKSDEHTKQGSRSERQRIQFGDIEEKSVENTSQGCRLCEGKKC